MKIIGPIAGIGSRLRPFTLSKPKAFITVAGKTVLDHILNKFTDTFDSDTELILIVGYKKRQIISYLNEQNYEEHFKLTFIEQIPRGYKDQIPYYWGLGEAVYLTRERFEEEKITNQDENKRKGALIFLGDMIPIDDYSYLLYRYYESDIDGIITVMKVPKEDASSYGVVVVNGNNLIQKLVEKPKNFVSDLAIAGIYTFSNKTMKALYDNIKKYLDRRTEDSKEVYLTESLQDLVDQGFKIAAVELKKGILDFGRPSEVLNGNKFLLEQNSTKKEDFAQKNIVVEKSWLKNPVHIGKGVKIFNSVIGPHVSIADETTIENSIISNSIIEKATTLRNIITSNSIIGTNANIEGIIKDNLIIGDKSVY
ncbi:MAG: sugar phosphate nucleotidyltransferase [Promethearchaeota archaeon]